MYTGGIELTSDDACHNYLSSRGAVKSNLEEIITVEEELLWCKLWVLADKVGSGTLTQIVINRFTNCLYYASRKEGTGPSIIAYVYDNTLESSPLRKVIANEFTRQYFLAGGTDESKKKILQGLSLDSKFGLEVLKQIESHVKMAGCTFYLSELCFCHEPQNP